MLSRNADRMPWNGSGYWAAEVAENMKQLTCGLVLAYLLDDGL